MEALSRTLLHGGAPLPALTSWLSLVLSCPVCCLVDAQLSVLNSTRSTGLLFSFPSPVPCLQTLWRQYRGTTIGLHSPACFHVSRMAVLFAWCPVSWKSEFRESCVVLLLFCFVVSGRRVNQFLWVHIGVTPLCPQGEERNTKQLNQSTDGLSTKKEKEHKFSDFVSEILL